MTIYSIPTEASTPFYTQRTDFEGSEFVLTFTYNQRENCWYISLADIDEVDLVRGVKIVCGVDLWGQKVSRDIPQGILQAIANTSDDSPPGLGELGQDKRVTLMYFTSDHV